MNPESLVSNHVAFLKQMEEKLAPFGHWRTESIANMLETFAESMFSSRYGAQEAHDPFPSR